MTLPNWTRRPRKMVLAGFQRVLRWGHNALRFLQARRSWLVLLVLVVATAVGIWAVINYWDWLSTTFWDWLRGGPGGVEPGSTTVRNLGLVIGGVIAILLAVWRSKVAERQANTAQQSLLNERYQKGAEMLGSEVLAVRLGGIYALQRLAEEHPGQYHIQIMRLFCAFARRPTKDEEIESMPRTEEKPRLQEDVQTVMTAIGSRSEPGLALEKRAEFTLDLHGADLSFARLSGANLSGADLSDTTLRHANFFETHFVPPDLSQPIPSDPNQLQTGPVHVGESITPDLSGVENRRANLSLSILSDADLSDAHLLGTDLSGALLAGANLSNSKIIYANLRKAVLLNAILPGAFVFHSDLSGAKLGGAELSGAVLPGAKLYGASLFATSVPGADLSSTTGLTQEQLDQARVDPDNPPKLDGVLDAETGEPLVWRGKPLDD